MPVELGKLFNLVSLELSNNQLIGEMPAELGNLANLREFDLAGNHLSGEIPAELELLSKLVYLDLAGNRLSGCIPGLLEAQLIMTNSNLGGLPFCTAPRALGLLCWRSLPKGTEEVLVPSTTPRTARTG